MRYLICFLTLTGVANAQDVLWDRSGDGNHAAFGSNIYAMGDQNDDGFDDWAIYAIGEYNGLPENEARFLLFYGGNPPETTPYMSFVRDPDVYLRFGGKALGDINGDGYVDWGIEVTFVSAPDSQVFHIFLGGPNADMVHDYDLDVRPLNSVVFRFGDFNGDGFDDIYHFNNTPPTRVTRMFFGSAEWDTIPDWVRHSDVGYIGLPDAIGDLNGDGFNDFVSGDPNVSGGGIYFGSPNPDTLPRQPWNTSAEGGTISSDMNGDGRGDIVTRLAAGAQVFFGADVIHNVSDASISFQGCSDGPVEELQSVGDFNDDGYDDVVAISQTCNLGWGKMALYLGSPWINPNPVIEIEGREPPLDLVGIFTAEPLGDVNNDGLNDFGVGCVNTDNDGRRGRVVIFSGDTTYTVPVGNIGPVIPDELSLTIYPNPVNSMATLDISSEHVTGPLGIIVYNILGQQVDRFTLNAYLQIRYSYNVSALASGQYIIQVYSNTSTTAQKLVVLK